MQRPKTIPNKQEMQNEHSLHTDCNKYCKPKRLKGWMILKAGFFDKKSLRFECHYSICYSFPTKIKLQLSKKHQTEPQLRFYNKAQAVLIGTPKKLKQSNHFQDKEKRKMERIHHTIANAEKDGVTKPAVQQQNRL